MNARILVVDDSNLARRTLRQILQTMGHTVDEASNGEEALERFYLQRPDVVFLDMVMHGMYGMDVLAKLRLIDPNVRVIVATADIQSSTRAQAEEMGANKVIHKPLTREKVIEVLESVLAQGNL